jgi:hypothetical protein
MKTVAYAAFWRQLENLNADHEFVDFEVTARSCLNINPEGELLKELYNIIEELRMMTRIYTQQLSVVESFSRQLEIIHEQGIKQAPKKLVDVMLEIKNLLRPRPALYTAEDPLAAPHTQSPTQNGTARVLTNVTPNGEDAATTASSNLEGSTVEFAKRVCRNIALRRKDFEALEESSRSVSDQVCRPISTITKIQVS